MIFVADAAHLTMILTNGIVVTLYTQTEMRFVVAQLVAALLVTQPSEF